MLSVLLKYTKEVLSLLQLHRRFYGEVLPYLEVKKEETEEEMKKSIEVPNVTGLSIKEATKTLKDMGLEVMVDNKAEEIDEEYKEKIVVEQLPKKGIQINSGATVTIFTE